MTFEQKYECTVLLPTMAATERIDGLKKAIRSVTETNTRAVEALLIVNGNRYDPKALEEVAKLPHVRTHYEARASLPDAITVGRRLVESPYFSFLDDDDEYLPGAVDFRIRQLAEAPDMAYIVTNGFKRRNGVDRSAADNLGVVAADPLLTLFDRNWLTSCGGLYRSEMVGVEFFEDIAAYREWTWVAFRLASAGLPMLVRDVPTFRVNDTPGSESKSVEYDEVTVDVLERMLSACSRRDVRAVIRARIAGSWHARSVIGVRDGCFREAWRSHLHSLRFMSGLKYIPYTLRILQRQTASIPMQQ